MAGDAGSPQSQPTDLSIKSRRGESDELKAYDYGNSGESRKSHFKFKSDMAAYYATFDKPCDLSNKSSVIKSTEGAIRSAMSAITKSLTPQGNLPSIVNSSAKRTPSDEEVFVYSNARNQALFRPGGSMSRTPDVEIAHMHFKKSNAKERPNSATPIQPKSASYINDKTYLYFKTARERPIQTTPSDTESKSLVEDKMNWRLSAADRPQYLDLQNVTDMSPDSGLGSATPIFGSVSTTSPETPGGSTKFGKRRKRKYGPGRGWKFHDLSNDGGSNRKRVYAQNKLENGVLQRFQEHVCVKSVASPDGSKDRLIVVEPSEIHDSDLIRAGTALRVVFDKDAGTYKLQLLPYTLEEGPLSDHDKVLQAVSKMLGFNNEVLCPNAFKAMIRSGSRVVVGDFSEDPRSFTPPSAFESLFEKAPMSPIGLQTKSDGKSNTKGVPQAEPAKSTAHQRDALLWSLNNELKKYNSAMADAAAAGRKTCLMWHTPEMGLPPGKKRYIATTKYCANCRVPTNAQQSGT